MPSRSGVEPPCRAIAALPQTGRAAIEPIQRKRRIVAKVQCRSIKNECPEPTCEEPALLPGRCCKTCPGDRFNPDIIHDVIPPELSENEEKSTKLNSVYQNATRKVCGVWKRLPREYRRLLKEERLYVVLGWGSKEQSEFTLSGQLTKYVALGTELFSSLLKPSPGTVVFNGIFLPDEISDVPVNVTLAFEDKKVILTEKVYVTKPATELNVVEISSPISQADLRLLTRGRLVLSVSSMSKQHSLKLSGMVMTKATCELFQTPYRLQAIAILINTGRRG
ncbi:chordin [Holotrichia oblita]|uniref:Chordin n=1 Tax=Holotrichia oblita TaxID=644536 RepID=A0ACB9T0P4_HOLOL|nr:chordin [Holotrichia oblita]